MVLKHRGVINLLWHVCLVVLSYLSSLFHVTIICEEGSRSVPMSTEDQEAQTCDLPKATASNTDTQIWPGTLFERVGSSSILLWPKPESCAANGRGTPLEQACPRLVLLGSRAGSPGGGPWHRARGTWHSFSEQHVYLEI